MIHPTQVSFKWTAALVFKYSFNHSRWFKENDIKMVSASLVWLNTLYLNFRATLSYKGEPDAAGPANLDNCTTDLFAKLTLPCQTDLRGILHPMCNTHTHTASADTSTGWWSLLYKTVPIIWSSRTLKSFAISTVGKDKSTNDLEIQNDIEQHHGGMERVAALLIARTTPSTGMQ